ncbi:MAG TPA: hypothetical protein VK619_05760, partial [Pyrinomonadaceae bacterium]|nr:hypothetical protein [Pyrinomonadaceae bacterium]
SALEPYGAGNARPVFVTRSFRIAGEPRVMKNRHLKLFVSGAAGRTLETVWWGGVEELDGQTLRAGDRIEMAYTVEQNTWRGETRLQLCVQDLKAVISDE